MNDIWRQEIGEGPIVAVAIHDGHALRDEVAGLMALSDAERLREEDPFTGDWTTIADTRVVGLRSRFEVDLNRPRDKAVYRAPEDAWGLRVWQAEPAQELVDRSLAEYDAFYANMRTLLADVERRHGRFVILDLHSYNHRRGGSDGPPAEASENPQVNIGTGTMPRRRWARVVERFMADVRAFDVPGLGHLDVRENVRFQGGYFPQWVHRTFPETGCALAIEFKKFFMDEWTGQPDQGLMDAIGEALRATIPGLREEFMRC
jgi:N-formylglutamate amidohydrolase